MYPHKTPLQPPATMSQEGSNVAAAEDPRPFIFMLPSELLSVIVEVVAANEAPRSPVSTRDRQAVQKEADPRMRERLWDHIVEGGSLGWIRLSHVCRSWRSHICENLPLLWARHVGCFRLPDALEEMLRRSGESTLLATQSGSGGYDPDEVRSPWDGVQMPVSSWSSLECTAFLSRLRSIRVIDLRPAVAGADDRDPPSFVVDDLSKLRALEVHHLYLDESSFDDEDKWLKPGAPVIRAPKLREIRFTNYFIPWTTPGLTHLSIALDHCNGIPGSVFLNALASIAPTIEVLELDYCLPGCLSEQVQSAHAFLRLRQLYLREMDDCVDDFLKIIDSSSVSLKKLDLTINPDSRHWQRLLKSTIEQAARLLQTSDALTLLSATQAWSEDVIFGSLHEYVRLGFSKGSSEDPYLTIAIENARHITKIYPYCLMEACYALGRDIWRNVHSVDLDFPLWSHIRESRVLAQCFMDDDLRELRLVDSLERVDSHVVWESPTLSDVFCSPTETLDKLWIVQHGEWSLQYLSVYCTKLAAGLKKETAILDKKGRALHKTPRIKLLRVDFIEKSGIVQGVHEDALSVALNSVAEKVELRFL